MIVYIHESSIVKESIKPSEHVNPYRILLIWKVMHTYVAKCWEC